MKHFMPKYIVASAILFFFTSAKAIIIPVQLNDIGGPQITGQVDTTADTFTINTWIETPGGVEYYTPSSLPLVWNATTSANTPFDVPDNWDGTIGNDWGFLAPSNIVWNEGPASIFGGILPGWGIGNTPLTAAANETIFESIPTGPTNRGQVTFDQVLVGTVATPATAPLFVLALLTFVLYRRREQQP